MWNYRVVEKKAYDGTFYYQIEEVYYDKNKNINGFGDARIPFGEEIDDIKFTLEMMLKALDKPVVPYEEYTRED